MSEDQTNDAAPAPDDATTQDDATAQDDSQAADPALAGDEAEEMAFGAGEVVSTTVVDPRAGEQGVEIEETTGVWPVDRLKPVVEALVFASGDPLTIKKMVDFIEGPTADEVKAALVELATDCLTRGIRLVEVAGGWQMRTAPEHQRCVRKLFRERPQKLSRAATETIAIVAYKQPVTRQEIETVRGVDSGGVLESLVERKLAKVVGRKDVPGRPLVYATTQEFLELFGLKNIRELPTLPELGHDFERMSDQGGFNETDRAAILPLEEEHGAQDDKGKTAGDDQGPGPQDGDVEGEARRRASEGEGADEGAGEGDDEGQGADEGAGASDAADEAEGDGGAVADEGAGGSGDEAGEESGEKLGDDD